MLGLVVIETFKLDSLGEPFDVFSIRDRFLGVSSGQGFLEVFDPIIQREFDLRKCPDHITNPNKHYFHELFVE